MVAYQGEGNEIEDIDCQDGEKERPEAVQWVIIEIECFNEKNRKEGSYQEINSEPKFFGGRLRFYAALPPHVIGRTDNVQTQSKVLPCRSREGGEERNRGNPTITSARVEEDAVVGNDRLAQYQCIEDANNAYEIS